jgi:hypothetical protein
MNTTTSQTERINPAIASRLIKWNARACTKLGIPHNFRPIDLTKVRKYANEIALGEWNLNGETIKMSGEIILDGQHRLQAIVMADTPITTIVVRGLPLQFSTIDRGKPRTIAQWCRHKGMKSASHLAAATKLIIFHEKGMWAKGHIQQPDIVDSELLTFVENKYDDIYNCIRMAAHTSKFVSASILGAIFYIGCGGKDPELSQTANWFSESLRTGQDLTEMDAVLHLRNKTMAQSKHNKIPKSMLRYLTTIAWNKTVTGEPCTVQGLRLRMTGPGKQTPPDKVLLTNV